MATEHEGWRVNEQTPSVVITPHGRISVPWHSNLDESVDRQAEEAARLIAAAPDLRAALEAICDAWERDGDVGAHLFAAGRDAVTSAREGD